MEASVLSFTPRHIRITRLPLGLVRFPVSGSNSVKITLDGEGEMQSIELSDEIIKEDKLIIEDLIVAAHNSAKSQLKTKTTEEISKATGGFGIPGFKWPL